MLFIGISIAINTFAQSASVIESHQEYEIAACQDIESNIQNDEYYVGCENGRINYFEDFSILSKSASTIERNIRQVSFDILNTNKDSPATIFKATRAGEEKIKQPLTKLDTLILVVVMTVS